MPRRLHTAVSDEIRRIAQTDPEQAAELRATSIEYANEVRGFYDSEEPDEPDDFEGPEPDEDEDEDDGCPRCDPDCMGNAEDCHDACEWPE